MFIFHPSDARMQASGKETKIGTVVVDVTGRDQTEGMVGNNGGKGILTTDDTPQKTNMEPHIHPIEKEHDQNQTSIWGFHVNFPGCNIQ